MSSDEAEQVLAELFGRSGGALDGQGFARFLEAWMVKNGRPTEAIARMREEVLGPGFGDV